MLFSNPVALNTSAWIEITGIYDGQNHHVVALNTSAWIEISPEIGLVINGVPVALNTSAWIEIFVKQY